MDKLQFLLLIFIRCDKRTSNNKQQLNALPNPYVMFCSNSCFFVFYRLQQATVSFFTVVW